MKDYYKILNIDQNLHQEQIADYLHQELRIWTMRTSNPKKEVRDEAEKMVKEISEALDIFKDPGAYNDYINKLNQYRNSQANQQRQQYQQPQQQQRQEQPQQQANNGYLTVEQALEKARSLTGYDNNEAFRLIDASIKEQPDNPKTWRALGDFYKATNKYDLSRHAYYKVFDLVPDDYHSAFHLFNLCALTNDNSDLEKMYRIIYDPIKDKSSPYALYLEGRYYLSKKMYQEALAAFKKASEIAGEGNKFYADLTRKPFNYGVTNANFKQEVARVYSFIAEEYKVEYEGEKYLTSKNDIYNYISCMENAYSNNPIDYYKNSIESAKKLFEKTELVEMVWLVVGFLVAITVLSPLVAFLPLVGIVLAVYLVNKFMKVPGYIANASLVTGKTKFSLGYQEWKNNRKRNKSKK